MPEDKDLKCLDQLIAEFGGADGGNHSLRPSGLLLEHIQAARRHLLGSMRGEYSLSLEQAKESIAGIPDKGDRARTKGILQGLIDSAAPQRARPIA